MGGKISELKQKISRVKSRPNYFYASCTVLLIALLVVCNIAFPETSGWARLFWNSLGYLGLYLIFRHAKLSFGDVGLSPKYFKSGIRYGFVAILLISAVFLGVYLIDSELFKDERYRQSLGTALVAVFIFLPLKTVLFEELAFRGLLPGLLMKFKSKKFSIVASSLAFGLWHVSSSFHVQEYSIAGVTFPGYVFIITAVLATSIAGYIFLQLRLRSKSLLAPIVVHWFINGAAILLAALSWA